MTGELKATPQIVHDYLRLFVNRRAYTVQSMRPHPASGRHYYFRPTRKETGDTPPLMPPWVPVSTIPYIIGLLLSIFQPNRSP